MSLIGSEFKLQKI